MYLLAGGFGCLLTLFLPAHGVPSVFGDRIEKLAGALGPEVAHLRGAPPPFLSHWIKNKGSLCLRKSDAIAPRQLVSGSLTSVGKIRPANEKRIA